MAGYDGNGNYIRSYSWVQDASNSINITASRVDTEDNGFAAALTLAVTRDGQGKMTQDFLPATDNTLNIGTAVKRWVTLNGTPIASIPSYPLTGNESAASVTPQVFSYPSANLGANVFRYLTAAQQANVSLNIGSIDVTAAIQGAINANPNAEIFFPAGHYLLTSALNIVNACRLRGVYQFTTFILGTQNQNGIVIGNGTSGGQITSQSTSIEGITFNPSATVAAFASGSCIFMNYTLYSQVKNCYFYGNNGSANILFTGVTCSIASEPEICNNYFSKLLGYGLYTSGTGLATRTVDGRFDNNEFQAIANDCVHLDANTAGCTINGMIAFNFSTWGIVINSGTTGAGSLHYILQPDIEADGTSGGIYIQNCANVDIVGGWMGTNVYTGTTPSLWVGAASNSVKVTGMQLQTGRVLIDGPACTLTGCDVVGDNVAATAGIVISSTATDTSICGGTVRQHATSGIQFTSTPPATRCKIVGVNFKSCGAVAGTGYEVVGSTGLPGSILGASGTPGNFPPLVRDCQSDVPYLFAAASTGSVTTSAGRDAIQITAAANITTITNLSAGNRLMIQAGAGGITLASGGNLALKSSPLAISAFKAISLWNDGQFWYQDGQNF